MRSYRPRAALGALSTTTSTTTTATKPALSTSTTLNTTSLNSLLLSPTTTATTSPTTTTTTTTKPTTTTTSTTLDTTTQNSIISSSTTTTKPLTTSTSPTLTTTQTSPSITSTAPSTTTSFTLDPNAIDSVLAFNPPKPSSSSSGSIEIASQPVDTVSVVEPTTDSAENDTSFEVFPPADTEEIVEVTCPDGSVHRMRESEVENFLCVLSEPRLPPQKLTKECRGEVYEFSDVQSFDSFVCQEADANGTEPFGETVVSRQELAIPRTQQGHKVWPIFAGIALIGGASYFLASRSK